MNHTQVYHGKKLPTKSERHKIFGSVEPAEKTKPTEKDKMPDLQNQKNNFLFALDAVGISNVKHPVIVKSDIKPFVQNSIGNFTFSSSLAESSKGTNMSRFTEQLHQYYKNGFEIDFSTLKRFAEELTGRLKQQDASIEVQFPWFFEREAPESGLSGLNHADVTMTVTYDKSTGFSTKATLHGKITTLCPCSKEISEYSAHNQRGNVTMEITFVKGFVEDSIDWRNELLEAAESNASARLFPVLKRPGKKFVTELAYENPRFVEDIVRLVSADLYEMEFVSKFKVSCTNEESIYLHDAMASITYNKESNE